MGLEGKRFNDGVIDLSSLAKKEPFDANKVMQTIPQQFQASDEEGNDILLETISAIVHPKGFIYIVLTDNIEGEPPFLMTASHKDNEMQDDLRPSTEEEVMDYMAIMQEYQAEEDQNYEKLLTDADYDVANMTEEEKVEAITRILAEREEQQGE